MAHDVFISYSSPDKPYADAVCASLEASRVRCWIAPRDVLPGLPYAAAITEAIAGSRLLVLVFSSHSNASPHVAREVEAAAGHGLPIVPVRVEKVKPSDSLTYFIRSLHWLDAMTPPFERHLQGLAETVHLLLARPAAVVPRPAAPTTALPLSGSVRQRGWLRLAWAALLLVAIVGGLVWRLNPQPAAGPDQAELTKKFLEELSQSRADLDEWKKTGRISIAELQQLRQSQSDLKGRIEQAEQKAIQAVRRAAEADSRDDSKVGEAKREDEETRQLFNGLSIEIAIWDDKVKEVTQRKSYLSKRVETLAKRQATVQAQLAKDKLGTDIRSSVESLIKILDDELVELKAQEVELGQELEILKHLKTSADQQMEAFFENKDFKKYKPPPKGGFKNNYS